jgi:hypothetical protein
MAGVNSSDTLTLIPKEDHGAGAFGVQVELA